MMGHVVVVRELVFGGLQAVCECGWMSDGAENAHFAECSWAEHEQDIKSQTMPWRVRIEGEVWEYGRRVDDAESEFAYFDSKDEALEFIEDEKRYFRFSSLMRDVEMFPLEDNAGVVVKTFDSETRTTVMYRVEDNLFEQVVELLKPVGF